MATLRSNPGTNAGLGAFTNALLAQQQQQPLRQTARSAPVSPRTGRPVSAARSASARQRVRAGDVAAQYAVQQPLPVAQQRGSRQQQQSLRQSLPQGQYARGAGTFAAGAPAAAADDGKRRFVLFDANGNRTGTEYRNKKPGAAANKAALTNTSFYLVDPNLGRAGRLYHYTGEVVPIEHTEFTRRMGMGDYTGKATLIESRDLEPGDLSQFNLRRSAGNPLQ